MSTYMINVNFLPWRSELKQKQKNQFIILIIFFVSVGVVFIFGWSFILNQTLSAYSLRHNLLQSAKENADSDIEKIEKLKKEKQVLLERMQIVQNLQSARTVPVMILQDISDLKSSGIFLKSFKTQDTSFIEMANGRNNSSNIILEKINTKITITGRADSRNSIVMFNTDLNHKSCWFKDVAWTSVEDSGLVKSLITDSILDFEITATQNLEKNCDSLRDADNK